MSDAPWRTARKALLAQELECHRAWQRLRSHIVTAEQRAHEQRHLDALAELHAAADLEYELTGGSDTVGVLIDALVAELGLWEETVHQAWIERAS